MAVNACGLTTPRVRSTAVGPPSSRQLSEFWVDADVRGRDLFYGIGGPELAPDADAHYELVKTKPRGFSPKFDVRGPNGQEWSVKLGPEAQTEVVASRLVWAMGYHEPPCYYLPSWQMVNRAGDVERQAEARFRPKLERLHDKGTWSWHENKFVDTRQYRGLLVLMMMLNSTDLKNDNNTEYEVSPPWEGARKWYVVKDLGASFGETGRIYPRRNWLPGFAQAGFITGVRDGRVQFDFNGRHQELLRDITPDDVRWMAERMSRLSDQQWMNAFKAAGYSEPGARGFIAKVKEKIAQGLALGERGTGR